MTEKKENFFKKAFRDMKEDTKAQHQVDKANFEAAKAEARANFEENRGSNTFKKAKEIAKQSWDDAHMTPQQRREKMRVEQAEQIAEAKARTEAARARTEAAKEYRKK